MADVYAMQVIENPGRIEGDLPQTGDNVIEMDAQEIPSKQLSNPKFFIIRDPRHKIWQLVTFFRRVFIYFTVVILADNNRLYLPSWGRVIFKCLPIFTLSMFVYHQYKSFSLLRGDRYASLIFFGLTFSYIADGLLVYQQQHVGYFLAGLICFAIAHVLYTIAFGWKPLKTRMLLRSLIASGLVYYYLYNGNLKSSGLGLIIGVAFYVLIIFAMQWRAWARISYRDITEGRMYEIAGALGASFFGLSDGILGVNKFNFPVPGADYSILATYYVGQMLITLSVIDGPNIDWPNEEMGNLEDVDGPVEIPKTSNVKNVVKNTFHWLVS